MALQGLGLLLLGVVEFIDDRSHSLTEGHAQHAFRLLRAAVPEEPVAERLL